MKRALNKSVGVESVKMLKTGADSSLTIGQNQMNKRTVFTSKGNVEVDHRPPHSVSSSRLEPETQSADEESDEDEAPEVCSLNTFKNKTQAAVLEEENEAKLLKLKEIQAKKEARAKRHERNLKQKIEKLERAKRLEALMLDKAVVADTDKLLEAQRHGDSSNDGSGSSGDEEETALDAAFEGKHTVFDDADNMEELEDMFKPDVPKSKNGVHVVSLETTDDYKVKKALDFKNRLFFGSAVKRMSQESFKNAEEKRRAKKAVQLVRNLRIARQYL